MTRCLNNSRRVKRKKVGRGPSRAALGETERLSYVRLVLEKAKGRGYKRLTTGEGIKTTGKY